jgi:hypothetical protein
MEQEKYDIQSRLRTTGTYLIMYGVNMVKGDENVESIVNQALDLCNKLTKELEQKKLDHYKEIKQKKLKYYK